MGIGYSVSGGYLIDNPLENLVYIPALTKNSIRQVNSGRWGFFSGNRNEGTDSIFRRVQGI